MYGMQPVGRRGDVGYVCWAQKVLRPWIKAFKFVAHKKKRQTKVVLYIFFGTSDMRGRRKVELTA